MQLKTLSLAAIGLLLLSGHGSNAVQAATIDDVAVVRGGEEQLSDAYLSLFDTEEDQETDFELSEDYADEEDYHPLTKRGETCAKYHTVSGSDSCVKLAKKYGVTLQDIYDWNPQIRKGCPNLNNGKKYCVKKNHQKHQRLLKCKKSSSSSSKKETRKKLQTKSAFTYYWIAQPSDYTGGKKVYVKTCSGKTIGSVGENYADALVMEGTGVVGSKIVNLGSCNCNSYKCFELVDKSSDPFGLTAYDTPLRPYVTIASNDIKKNTKIYVPALVGWKIPGSGKTHNGCLLVDDQSWSFNGKHIDFYVYSMSNYEKLDKQHRINHVDIYEGGSCKLLNYM
ncbi:hypothetical protein BDF20DRAFT_818565 [Mycotypha africana]|uniref:uncharacterized protein n=1 Tax=Mycotypha africana TaxID=64632 RepID=UPI002300EE22|nr:uncharacterized protein BDF20DRAFT_818565 [Mycotypha africana]KAI8982233.1 hypothetical protein BDF20DRAFT_818565 [Mycotypha africana]